MDSGPDMLMMAGNFEKGSGKANNIPACAITLSHGLDLELVYEDQEHVRFLVEQGVTKGTARRFIRDIHEWATMMKRILPHKGSVEENFDGVAN
uniref:Uncharacterized protein n=1 Tax=Coccidioides posadasii RMSCC 3488 TaxID=454284 RepID=A0A0J6F6J2_COCPO|nr:hypothetical protein CPAG_01247 [Coccidioides posadasii RMSCC 3488]